MPTSNNRNFELPQKSFLLRITSYLVIKRICILVISISVMTLVLGSMGIYISNPVQMHRFDDTSLFQISNHPNSNETDLRVIIMTRSGPNAREESCYRLLKSLQNISNKDNDRIAVDIWIDKPKPEVIITQKIANKTQIFVDQLFVFKSLWKHGEFKIHIWENHAGLRRQWIDTWHESVKHIGGLTPNLTERAVILEDDLELSPFFWKYLKLAHNYYENNDNIAGFTLARASLCAAHCPNLNGGPTNIFAYRLVGSWGYSPKAKHWYKFRKWYHNNVNYSKPYVEGLTPTEWYKQKEIKHSENDTIWTMHHIKYCDIDQHKDKYTIYVKCANGKTLATNHKEPGLNYGAQKTASIDFPYLKQWDKQIINFPNDSSLIYLGWNGKPETLSSHIQTKAKDFIISNINFSNIAVWMTNDEKQLFAETILSLSDQPINKTKRYLEWGSGGSTQLISILGTNVNSKFYSIEHSVSWCDKMLNKTVIQFAINIGKLKYECVDTGQQIREWGVPVANANISEISSKYVNRIDMLNENHFDIVLIDGRFRVECAMKLLIGKYIDIDSIVLVHDYTIRSQYYSIDKYYDRINSIDTLVLFRVKKNVLQNETFMNLAKEEFNLYRLDVDRRMISINK